MADFPSPRPEPSEWAMMLAGLGIVRRGRRTSPRVAPKPPYERAATRLFNIDVELQQSDAVRSRGRTRAIDSSTHFLEGRNGLPPGANGSITRSGPAALTLVAGALVTVALAARQQRQDGNAGTPRGQWRGDLVHQINFVLQRTPGLTAERAAEAKNAILERLMRAGSLVKGGRAAARPRPRSAQRLEAIQAEILARAHLERIAAAVPKPDDKESPSS